MRPFLLGDAVALKDGRLSWNQRQQLASERKLMKAAEQVIEAIAELGAIDRSAEVDHTDPDMRVDRALDGWCDVTVRFRYNVRERGIAKATPIVERPRGNSH